MYRIDFNATAKKSITLTLFALFLLMCIFSLMIGSTFYIAKPNDSYLSISSEAQTTAQRLDFLRALGYSPDPDSEESEQVKIPLVFGDVYTRYNELQKQSGGDLSLYKGAECTRYTYADVSANTRLNLLVLDGHIIGGDECTLSLDGELKPLGGRIGE